MITTVSWILNSLNFLRALYEGVSQNFRTESERVIAAKPTRLTHKIAIQLHLLAELYHLQFSLQAASPETLDISSYIFNVSRSLDSENVRLTLIRLSLIWIWNFNQAEDFCVVMPYDVSEDHATSIFRLKRMLPFPKPFTSSWRWRQRSRPKCWHPTATL